MIYDLKLAIDRQRAEKRFVQLMKECTKIVLTKKVKRSVSQNSYLHLLIGFFALETGYTTTEAKQIYKEVNSLIYEYIKDDKTFLRSSADLNTKEMTDSIERFRNYSSVEAQIYLPSPQDRGFLEEIEIELSKNNYI